MINEVEAKSVHKRKKINEIYEGSRKQQKLKEKTLSLSLIIEECVRSARNNKSGREVRKEKKAARM